MHYNSRPTKENNHLNPHSLSYQSDGSDLFEGILLEYEKI